MGKDADTTESFDLLFKLDALTRLNTNLSTWLEVNYINGDHSQFVRNQIKVCLSGLKRHMIALTHAFTPSEELMDSMLAPQDGDLYNSVVNRIYSAPHAFNRTENWRELYHK